MAFSRRGRLRKALADPGGFAPEALPNGPYCCKHSKLPDWADKLEAWRIAAEPEVKKPVWPVFREEEQHH